MGVIGGVGLIIVGVVAAGLIVWCCWCHGKRSPLTASRIGQIQSSDAQVYADNFKNAGITEPNEKELELGINQFNEAHLKAPEAFPPSAYSSMDFLPNADLGAKHSYVFQYH